MTLTILYRHYDVLGDGNDRFARMTCPDNVDLNVYIGQGDSINFAIGNMIELTLDNHEVIRHIDFNGNFTTNPGDSDCLVHALKQCIDMIKEDATISINDEAIYENTTYHVEN